MSSGSYWHYHPSRKAEGGGIIVDRRRAYSTPGQADTIALIEWDKAAWVEAKGCRCGLGVGLYDGRTKE